MSLPKLYLETTIPSYLAARRSRDLRLAADQETTEEWWEQRRRDYELFTSEVVDVENPGRRLAAEPGDAECFRALATVLQPSSICSRRSRRGAHCLRRRARHGLLADMELQTHQQPSLDSPHRARLQRAWVDLPCDLHTRRTPAIVSGHGTKSDPHGNTPHA